MAVIDGGGSDSNWTTQFSTAEDPEIMALLYDTAPFSDEMHQNQNQNQQEERMELPLSIFFGSSDHVDYYTQNTNLNDCNSTITGWSQGCDSNPGGGPMSSSSFHFAAHPFNHQYHHHHHQDIESYYLSEAVSSEVTNGCPIPMELLTMEADHENNNDATYLTSPAAYLLKDVTLIDTAANGGGRDSGQVPDQKPAPKREHPDPEPKKNRQNATPKKKSKVNGKGVRSKKDQKSMSSCIDNPEECNLDINSTAAVQTSVTLSSEDDSGSVQLEINDAGEEKSLAKGGARSSKTRAGRGSATDPQSLYARKRRERINERLKILQNLIPNGTKVDISTMLEEAVEYVKFLQLQIKLLSSDDKWMYAPIAYNGMDIGLDLKISPPV